MSHTNTSIPSNSNKLQTRPSTPRVPWWQCVIACAISFFIGRNTAPTIITSLCPDPDPDRPPPQPCITITKTKSDNNNTIPPKQRRQVVIADNSSVVTCDAKPCIGFFRYDAPNHFPNATEILSAENKTYWREPRYKIFFPTSTTPETCIKEWEKNQKMYRFDGMSAWGEDIIIFKAFFNHPKFWNNDRFYLEIGGHNGVRASNTRFFDVCLGWNGLLVEPIPQSYYRMVKLRPNAHHLGMAPSCTSPSVVKFKDHSFTNAVANEKGAKMKIHCGPLSHPLRQMSIRHIDFWSLDVEGSELGVLQTVAWDEVQIDIIIAESENRLEEKQRLAEDVRDFLKEKGYIIMKSVTVKKSDIFLHKNACCQYKHLPECSSLFENCAIHSDQRQ